MQILRAMLIKTCSKTMQRIYTEESLQWRSLINSMHARSTSPLTALPYFHLLNCKMLLQVAWAPQWYFVTYATRNISIGTFKIFKPEFLKVTSFRRWNETVFQKVCDSYCVSKILLKNMSVVNHFELCAF